MASSIELDSRAKDRQRLAFGLACVERCSHLLEDDRAKELLESLRQAVASCRDLDSLRVYSEAAQAVARSHPGSPSIDGSGHSAVSATHALAHAFAGRAVAAAEYSAYALVYSYGRYAIEDSQCFEPEFQWQVRRLAEFEDPMAGEPESQI